MTSSNEQPASGTLAGGVQGSGVPGGLPPGRSDLSFIPVVWLAFVMAWSAYGLVSAWWLVGNSGLPDTVFYFVLGALAFDIITILWGLYLLGLAFGRSAHFPRHFTFWQIAIIVFLLARQAYVLAVPDFVFSARSMVITAAEIGIGLFCIYLLRRDAGPAAIYTARQAQAPSVFASIVAALLGIILGAVVGAVAGFALGAAIAEVTDISCFEGGCGYFAVFIGLAGLVVGAIGGGILGVWLVHRRSRKATI
ncbi:hypothetical protein NKI36_19375 [Mesorhizobium caraganae]|uniref:DUF2569 domain-containing protein n=1 Tax=Mesorhizobium caraganae TaxID=483206 RepID=A0ABV1Z2I5_9HYPH